jgi:hypothetical protein
MEAASVRVVHVRSAPRIEGGGQACSVPVPLKNRVIVRRGLIGDGAMGCPSTVAQAATNAANTSANHILETLKIMAI